LRYGDILASRRNYGQACQVYRKAIDADPANLQANEHLDNCLKFLKKDPYDIQTRLTIAKAAETSGDFTTAIVEYRRILQLPNGDSGPINFALAKALRNGGKPVEAYDQLKTAIRKDWTAEQKVEESDCHNYIAGILREYAYVAKNMGNGSLGMKRLNNAAVEYRRAVTINPANFDAIKGLIECAQDAVAIKPDSFTNHFMLGTGYQLNGDFEKAKAEYETCWKLQPNNRDLDRAKRSFHLAVVTRAAQIPGQEAVLASSMQKITDMVQRNPSDPELLYMLGKAKEGLGDDQGALAAYKQAAEINPHINPDLQDGLKRLGGGSTQDTGTKTAGKSSTPKNDKPNDEEIRQKKIAEIEGKISQGQVDEAQAQLLEMVKAEPTFARAWYLLGSIQQKQGDNGQAAAFYRQAASLKDADAASALRQIDIIRVQPMFEAADKAVKENNYVGAASSLREALSLAPDLPIVHRKLADVLEKLGDSGEANKERKKADELEKSSKS
jgi:Tfp pilus assembly protein PilF